MDDEKILLFIIVFFTGITLGASIFWISFRIKRGSFETIGKGILHKAECDVTALKQSQELLFKQKQIEQQRDFDQVVQAERRKFNREEERIKLREDKLEERIQNTEKKLSDLERREGILSAQQHQLKIETDKNAELHHKLTGELERISGLSINQAKDLLSNRIKEEVQTEVANFIRKSKKQAEEEADQHARRIITTAINRLAVPCVSEASINTVPIPNDEMKGRIIGREGRNIRTLELATGVNFVIDETPGAVVLSGYDPVRVYVAKKSLLELVADGRIYPTRIEEVVEKNQLEVKKEIRQHGEDASIRIGIMNLHPELITLLGRLKFRYSYGQNILEHSIEVSHLMGIMASELGLDVKLAKRIGLLHDMGKAVTHEMEGSHAIIGHDLALKYGETKEVANGIGCHHNEMSAITIEGSMCSSADAISASRPGARSEAIEEYVKRLRTLEEIALEYPGVDKAYAMQAGREVRIFVLPDQIDDDALINLARDVTKRIEKEVNYPGKVKVTVIREKRVVEYAL